LRFGLKIERDLHFKASKTLSAYATEARRTGSILAWFDWHYSTWRTVV